MTTKEFKGMLNHIAIKEVRKTILEDGLVSLEELANMTDWDVCELVTKNYLILRCENVKTLLVHRNKLSKFEKLVKELPRC